MVEIVPSAIFLQPQFYFFLVFKFSVSIKDSFYNFYEISQVQTCGERLQ